MSSVTFHVDGVPTPKGSMTRMPNGAMLPGSSKGQRIKQSMWRADVRHAAREAMGEDGLFTGALRVSIDCTLPYPRSSTPKYKLGWMPAIKQPDIDKLARGVLDHLTGIVWVDDSQVCWLMVNKSYAWDDRPGATIIVDAISDVALKELAQLRLRVEGLLTDD